MIRRNTLAWNTFYALVAVTTFLSFAPVSRACDTPVYRYAMYRWFPAPYEVYYFLEGELDDAGKKMKAAIDKVGESVEAPANIVFLPVDLRKDKELTSVPPDIKQRWQKEKDPTLPRFLVSSPVGGDVFSGTLSTDDLATMIDSPVRQQTGKLLEAGNAGVFILLKGEDSKANKEAEQVVRSLIDDVTAGKVSLYSMPFAEPVTDDEQADDEQADDEQPGPPKLSIGLLTLARDDPKEKWFVDCLLAVERDLRELKEPMLFLIYGRGRALPPYVGGGIHRDNLLAAVEFITGACSCTVKEQNPGVDLLMQYNWDAAAETLAQRFGTEEGSPYDYAGDALFPELIIPPDTGMASESDAAADAGSASEKTDVVVAADATSLDRSADGDTSADESVSATVPKTGAAASADESTKSEKTTTGEQHASARIASLPASTQGDGSESVLDGASAPSPTSMTAVVWVGVGLLGALVVLFGATFLVLRPR